MFKCKYQQLFRAHLSQIKSKNIIATLLNQNLLKFGLEAVAILKSWMSVKRTIFFVLGALDKKMKKTCLQKLLSILIHKILHGTFELLTDKVTGETVCLFYLGTFL